MHLFAALDHASGVVLGQTEIDARTKEITAFTQLCDRVGDLGINLAEIVVTADAVHWQDRCARDLNRPRRPLRVCGQGQPVSPEL